MASPLLLVLSYRTHAEIPKSQQRDGRGSVSDYRSVYQALESDLATP